ncbi:Zn(II)2Cys6 transcription factor [Aspergillus alliaceus]|uniref:Zn(II)2Cys6 transcription factor n=1 Tax=Petromyces alliaceus TaxID=209559 RepID=UPI0012A5B0C2|nr:fungal-specific transcription factor domain-containing protein [Aspergillus alliaceus]KAB8231353.1 fungal-specific transcription factor domain-containing protein [Aspergillus alliaceus]
MNRRSPEVQRQEIDRVLQLKRKQREAKACYPCRQRKVKCDSGQPCRTCQKRGHPQICVYDVTKDSSRHSFPRSGRVDPAQATPSHPQPEGASPITPSTASPNGAIGSLQSDHSQLLDVVPPSRLHQRSRSSSRDRSDDYVFSGQNSVVSILRLQDPDGSMARDAGSVLGLQNTYDSYPFIDLKTPTDRWFFHHHRLSAHPFNPILVDIDGFESAVCTFLGSVASGELSDPNKISQRWSSDRSIGHISLLLATLASGAHFSDLEYPQRSEVCQDLARRSFQALRLANFLFRPSLDIVQAMLILGNMLQNNGQSDAAWALLGTTVRLAQALGLHTQRGTSHLPEIVRSRAKKLWSMTVWQDCLLSLCYDRPPVVSISGWQQNVGLTSAFALSFTDVMHFLCQLGLDIAKVQEPEQWDLTRATELLTALDNVYSRAQPHLLARDHCHCLQHHQEHLALRMHFSFCVSVLCRPTIRSSPSRLDDPRYTRLRIRAKESLMDASQAFLDFQTLSIVPLRTWSMVHTVLSSALLLCVWQETRNDSECRDLQQRVITVFSNAEPPRKDTIGLSDHGQWLSARHIRALVALRNAVRNVPFEATGQDSDGFHDQGQTNHSSLNLNPNGLAAQGPMFMPGFDLGGGVPGGFGNYFPEGVLINNTADLSPVTYLDSIMNVPLFNISEDNSFL